MAKSATKKKSSKSTKSSVQKKELKLSKKGEQAVKILQTVPVMEFFQFGATAIRDIGFYDVEQWSGGFENLYKITFNTLFDKDRNLREQFYPILKELELRSSCAGDKEMLAAALGRIGFTFAFATVANERNK